MKRKFLCCLSGISESSTPFGYEVDGLTYWVFKHNGVIRVYLKCGHNRALCDATVEDGKITCCMPYMFLTGQYIGTKRGCGNLQTCEFEITDNAIYILRDTPVPTVTEVQFINT